MAETTQDITAWWSIPEEVDDPQWSARRRLAAALREVGDLCLTSTADGDLLAAAAAAIEDARDQLATAPTQSTSKAWREGAWFSDPGRFADRNLLVGHCHPFAPPMTVLWDGSKATGTVTLRASQGGAPGIAHGGVVAALFDQVFGHAVVYAGLSGLTVELNVRYERPTPLDTPLVLTVEITEAREKSTRLTGTMHVVGREALIASATASFVQIDARHMQRMTRER